jgi:hypothetical protein
MEEMTGMKEEDEEEEEEMRKRIPTHTTIHAKQKPQRSDYRDKTWAPGGRSTAACR